MIKTFDAPIPGENYTSDTKNYPWHRPSDITDYDEAVEYMLNHLSNDYNIKAVMALMEADISIPTIVDIHVTNQISKGTFSIDLAILIAGPIAVFLEIMAKRYGINPNLGDDTEKEPPTAAFIKEAMMSSEENIDTEEVAEISDELTEQIEEKNPQGLMGAPSQIEQDMMLGLSGDVEEETEEQE